MQVVLFKKYKEFNLSRNWKYLDTKNVDILNLYILFLETRLQHPGHLLCYLLSSKPSPTGYKNIVAVRSIIVPG